MPTIRSAATALLAALAISLMTAGTGIADDTPVDRRRPRRPDPGRLGAALTWAPAAQANRRAVHGAVSRTGRPHHLR
jgi:hypothetical protein